MGNFLMRSLFAVWLATASNVFGRGRIPKVPDPQDFEGARKAMITDQIKKRGIDNPRLLAALSRIPRHLFVPAEQRQFAYCDQALPIGNGQTISQPYIVALMTNLLDPQPEHRLLEIGTGSGYQAAVLAKLAKEVCTIEIVPELAESSARVLKELGITNVTVLKGDGFKGWPEKAPFDGIIITCAIDRIPAPLEEQVKQGGRIVAPLGNSLNHQELTVATKKKGNSFEYRRITGVVFVPMTGPNGMGRTSTASE